MIKADSDRLLKALAISIMFHAFMFGGMNLLDWFPEMDIPERLAPVTVRIEKSSSASALLQVEEEFESVPAETPENIESVSAGTEHKTAVSSDVAFTSVPDAAGFDPYTDLEISNNALSHKVVPFPDESDVSEDKYVPPGSTIEYDKEPLNVGEVVIPQTENDNADIRVVSGKTIGELEKVLTNEGEQSSLSPRDPSNYDSDLYVYNDFPIEFNSPGVTRKLVSEPSIIIPSDISDMISSERTVLVEFSLNDDGRLYYLKIKQSSGYSLMDNSIISELRKWEFDKAPGSIDVGGIVTIILKGR